MSTQFDLLIVGGGINGAGIARDAAGRGLRVLLVEQHDLASHTSSASTKLIHGGLRYLEYFQFRLVREALRERERLLAIAPHIVWPLRFVMPLREGGRPAWLIRTGLFLYDHLGGRQRLPGSQTVALREPKWGRALKPALRQGFAYSDCWVEDSRLVVLNALDARDRGADIRTRTRFLGAEPSGAAWRATIEGSSGRETMTVGAIVNTAGPWVHDVLDMVSDTRPERRPRLVKGSHIVLRRLYEGDHAFILQNPDKRIVFAIPYEGEFTLLGTTDVPTDSAADPTISREEIDYLCESVSRYFAKPVVPGDIVHTYCGIRPLYDNGKSNAAAVTRDYELVLGRKSGPQLLSAFGGKITTYRRLAEHALHKLAGALPTMGAPWTADAPLPGGDLPSLDFERAVQHAIDRWPFLPHATTRRLVRAYGTRTQLLIGNAATLDEMGRNLGGGLTTREVDYLLANEWAITAEDILWRRSKLGLHVDAEAVRAIETYLAGKRA